MNKKYKQCLPKWFGEQGKHDLVLSNDIDSLASCALLNKVNPNWKIRYFYDFKNCYASKLLKDEKNDRIWVDVAVLNGEKAFDNHVSMVSIWDEHNRNMINPNLINNVTNENYTDKYAGSTLLMLWSLYDIPLPETEEGKMLLLAIDIAFKGHYNERFEETNTFYICEMFGFDELYDVMERHSIDEFYALIDKYNLNEDIEFDDGELKTKLKLNEIGELLGLKLYLKNIDLCLWKSYEIKELKTNSYMSNVGDISPFAFTLAFTYKNSVRYSKLKGANKWKDQRKLFTALK